MSTETAQTVRSVRALVVATSLNPGSRSSALAGFAMQTLQQAGVPTDLVDLRELPPLPFGGSPEAYSSETIRVLQAQVRAATHLLIALPVYNFAPSAVAKNLVEVLGDALEGKTVGFLCAAGGPRGYMSVLPLANALMLDYRCWIVPRFVYATRADVQNGQVTGEEVKERITRLCVEMLERVLV